MNQTDTDALTAERDAYRADAHDLAEEVAELRRERDVARADTVGAERTLEAVRAHLMDVLRMTRHLEGVAHPLLETGGPAEG